jgi:hypothetical protein
LNDERDDVAAVSGEEHEEQPRGTFLLTLGFLGLIVVLWFWTYAELLGRS